MIKLLATFIIRKQAKEYLKEFKKAHLAERDEDFYIYMGDNHYFEFECRGLKIKLISITDVI